MKVSFGVVVAVSIMCFCIVMHGVVAPFPDNDPRSDWANNGFKMKHFDSIITTLHTQ